MNRIISLFLFIFIASCLNGQYNSPIRNKVTLGKQTTADGLVWRGRTSDTANLMTNKLDTSVYLVLDTMTEAMWLYRVTTTPKWNRVVDSLNNMQGTLSVAKGGTGSATQNFVDLTTTQSSIGGAKTFTSALSGTSASFSGTLGVTGNGSFGSYLGLNNRTTPIYSEQLTVGSFSVPKITLAQSGGYRWSTYLDATDAKYRIRYEDGSIDPLVIDRLGAATFSSSVEVYNDNNLGSEMVANGTFAGGITAGWQNDGYETWTAASGALISINDGTGNGLMGNNAMAFVLGARYTVTFDYTLNSGTSPTVYTSSSFYGSPINTLVASGIMTTGNKSFTFTSTGSATFLIFYSAGVASNFTIDNVSVKEVIGGNIVSRGLFTGGGTNGLKINASGNVGIGTNQPTSKLDVVGNIEINDGSAGAGTNPTIRSLNNFSGFSQLQFYPQTGTNVNQSFQVIPRGTGASNNKTQFVIFGTDYIADGTNTEYLVLRARNDDFVLLTGKDGTGTQKPFILSGDGLVTNQLVLATNSNVGIGTTSPGNLLTIKDKSQIGFRDETSNSTREALSNYAYTPTYGDGLKIGTGYNAVSINGNVGIGTTSPLGNLEIRGANRAGIYDGILQVNSNNSAGINLGGSLSFGGVWTSTNVTEWSQISGRKENATDANYAGYLAFATRPMEGANTERMRIASNGNVGIGTVSPTEKLHVAGDGLFSSTSATTTQIRLKASGSTTGFDIQSSANDGYLWNRDNGAFYFGTNNLQRLVISSTGAATFSSSVTAQSLITSYSLDGDPVLATFTNANAGTSAEATIYVRNGTTNNDATFIQAIGTGFTTTGGFVQDGGVIGTGTTLSGGMSLIVRANADMRFYTNGHTNERMRITSGGNVGIGTASPLAPLQISSPTGGAIRLQYGTNSGYGQIETSAANDLIFKTNGAAGINNRMTILETNGNVGIGTGSPTQKLHVVGNSLFNTNIVTQRSTAATGSVYYGFENNAGVFKGYFGYGGSQTNRMVLSNSVAGDVLFVTSNSFTSQVLLRLDTTFKVTIGNDVAPTEVLHVVGNGRFTAVGSGAYGNILNITSDGTLTTAASSDINFKYNINPISYGLETILKLKPVSYQWINGDEYDLGFIAQDAVNVIPEAVDTFHDSSLLFRYNTIIPILTKAIQEQNVLIKALEQRIINLENK